MLIRISVLVCLGGCSFTLKGPDPFRAATAPPQCDTSKGLVGLDVVTAAAAGVAGLALASNNNGGAGTTLLLTSAVFGAAAWHGNGNVDRCRTSFHDYEVAMLGEAKQRGAPPALAAAPRDPYEAPVAAAPVIRAKPPEAPSVAKPEPLPVAKPEPPPVAKPEPPRVPEADAFHVPVGASPPTRPRAAKPAANPSKPTSDDVWRDFWREVL